MTNTVEPNHTLVDQGPSPWNAGGNNTTNTAQSRNSLTEKAHYAQVHNWAVSSDFKLNRSGFKSNTAKNGKLLTQSLKLLQSKTVFTATINAERYSAFCLQTQQNDDITTVNYILEADLAIAENFYQCIRSPPPPFPHCQPCVKGKGAGKGNLCKLGCVCIFDCIFISIITCPSAALNHCWIISASVWLC